MTTLLTSIIAGLEQHSDRVSAALQAAPSYERPKIIVPPGGRRLLWLAVRADVSYINFMYRSIKNGKFGYICELQGLQVVEAEYFTAPQFVAPGCKAITFDWNITPDQYLAALAELVK